MLSNIQKKFSKQLRSQSTNAESILWYHLRNRRFFNLKFRRQMPMANYIVDFVCVDKQVVIELDGGQHAEQINYDNERTKVLNRMGYRVLRIWNTDIFTNLEGVLNYLKNELEVD